MKKILSALAVALCGLLSVTTAIATDITVKNAAGEQVVPQNPQKVVVLDLAAADTIRALGEKDKIVGITNGIYTPQYLQEFNDAKYTNVGTMPEPSFEKINELAPDLIVAGSRQLKVFDRLKEIAPVFIVQNDYNNFYQGIEQNVTALGQIFNKEAEAQSKLAALNDKVTELQKLTKDKTALVILVNESNISAYGDTSRYSLVYQKFGFTPVDKNIKSSTHGMKVGFEYVLEQNPDYLLVVDRTSAITEKAGNAQKVLNNEIINQTKAAKNGNIVYLQPANWYLAFGGLEGTEMMAAEIENAVTK
ncbi:iron complex transport system substrate-binding protein [Cricetibacter osteomyelitidis]|uniref:Iron complex transport system substrate-binding protein n=1 Tax=Cricetibacter osteomyelitidis TaxID=1521931 RepID=A0A4R2T8K6_9PAST|nr:siderophore ABC transporter substrate-binding protein [Cricetibacter osteomyelitidis]TCP93518.1 iron complex transport system substrate-binding protein [Cricetibacter osteomyelitidis]